MNKQELAELDLAVAKALWWEADEIYDCNKISHIAIVISSGGHPSRLNCRYESLRGE